MTRVEINAMRELTADELNLIGGGKDWAAATAQSAKNLMVEAAGVANLVTGGAVAQVLVDAAVIKAL